MSRFGPVTELSLERIREAQLMDRAEAVGVAVEDIDERH